MKKNIFFFFLFFFLIFKNTLLAEPAIWLEKCQTNNVKNFTEKFEDIEIKDLELKVKNYRKWTKNGIKIITSNSRYISTDYKKNFSAEIIVTYKNDLKCFLKAKIRQSGDEKDHVYYKDNFLLQSLDVSLEEGSINGITNFKLFVPNARGNLEDEIIQTNILRSFNYLAPRTYLVKVKVNEVSSLMIFQEKAEKELLEYNKRREGPILEGDERFFWSVVQNIPFDQKSNWDKGIPYLLNNSIKSMLTKSTNSKLISRSENHEILVLEGIDRLNMIYLNWINNFQSLTNNYNYFDYDLDNNLLGMFGKNNILKLSAYNLLMISTNSVHGLATPNRKFYWNSIENYFEPINYDSNVNISKIDTNKKSIILRPPFSNYYLESFNHLINKFKKLDLNKLHNEITFSGLNISLNKLEKKIEIIKLNLDSIKKEFLLLPEEQKKISDYILANNFFDLFYESINKIEPEAYLTKKNNKLFERCNLSFLDCTTYNLENDQIVKLLNGKLILNKKKYQYLNNTLDFNLFKNSRLKNHVIVDNTDIFFDDTIDLKVNEITKEIEIKQNKNGSKILFINGEIINYSIKFLGNENLTTLSKKKIPDNYPINKINLTGCITFVNLAFDNVNINASNSTCEDLVNFINVSGQLNNIDIKNSYRDGFDADFSSINVNLIKVSNSLNDCLDLSAGNYIFKEIIATQCGDKGLSVGEKSNVIIDNLNVVDAIIGVASKDSSITQINNSYIKNSETCFSSYNKKPEFFGAFLTSKKFKCMDFKDEIKFDTFSKIKLTN